MPYILLIAIGLAMDAFSVSVALGGVSDKKVCTKGLISSAVFGLFQAIMPIVGWIIGETFKSFVSGVDHWIAFFLLFSIGSKMIYGDLKKNKNLLEQKNVDFRLFSLTYRGKKENYKFKLKLINEERQSYWAMRVI